MNLEELTLQEQEAFELYKHKYEALHPLPERPGVGGLSWKFWLLLVTSISAVLLASRKDTGHGSDCPLLQD